MEKFLKKTAFLLSLFLALSLTADDQASKTSIQFASKISSFEYASAHKMLVPEDQMVRKWDADKTQKKFLLALRKIDSRFAIYTVTNSSLTSEEKDHFSVDLQGFDIVKPYYLYGLYSRVKGVKPSTVNAMEKAIRDLMKKGNMNSLPLVITKHTVELIKKDGQWMISTGWKKSQDESVSKLCSNATSENAAKINDSLTESQLEKLFCKSPTNRKVQDNNIDIVYSSGDFQINISLTDDKITGVSSFGITENDKKREKEINSFPWMW
jgi:hypothetical protein